MSRLKEILLPSLILSFTLVTLILVLPNQENEQLETDLFPKVEKTVVDRAENSQERREHFFRLTRNPKTNEIPHNIRAKELEYAKSLKNSLKGKSTQLMEDITITEAGPNDVGGRTRGLGLDTRNSDIILAGGASGGMWKSTNGGQTWAQTSELGDNLGVTSLVQDPGNLDTWFYSTGEFLGASSRARGGGGQLYGSGIYTSTDNGDSWSQIAATADNDVSFNSEFDFISRVEVSPTTGTKFFASNAIGIYRSLNNFVSNSLVLGDINDHIYSDVQVASNGTVVALLSRAFQGVTPDRNPGVYISTNDGVSWTEITPGSYPSAPGRGVIGISPSDPNKFYVFVADNSNRASIYYFDISDLNNVVAFNRTNNIPDFGPPVGDLNLQGGYNMVCEVHPTDPDIVVIGGTNLYRSQDGFTSAPVDQEDQQGNPGSDGFADSSEKNKFWVGGYAKANNISQYSNNHPDHHAVVFDPNNINTVVNSHDGGISRTTNITNSSVSWLSLNNGYNITQFYTGVLHPDAGDTRILGGTQDNGSPFFNFTNANGATASDDISSGDGSYAYLGTNYLTTSSQRGRLIKYEYDANGDPTNFSFITPSAAENQLFIHPYLVNHTNEDIIFYPDGNKLFRNNVAISSNSNVVGQSWTDLDNLSTPSGTLISTLAISTTNPSNVLYYASFSGNSVPQIFRLANSGTTESTADLNIQSFTVATSDSIPPAGAYIHDITVSEDNGNEIIAVVSNYSTESVYYSTNGGSNWTGVGGNLEPNNGNGPSVRTAAITKTSSGEKTYFVGTSAGLYATNTLDGASTEWKLQGETTIGNTVVEYLDYRPSDNTLAIATHGRGMFLGNTSMSVSNEGNEIVNVPEKFNLDQNYPNPFNPSTTISYSLPANSNVAITVYDINGRKVAQVLNGVSQSAGSHDISFDASNLASGVYLYRINATSTSQNRSFSQVKRMTLIK